MCYDLRCLAHVYLHCVDWIYGVFVCVRNLPVSQVRLPYLKRLGPMVVLEFA